MKLQHFFRITHSDVYNYETETDEKFEIGISYDGNEFEEAHIELKSTLFNPEKRKHEDKLHAFTSINKNELIKLKSSIENIIQHIEQEEF